MVDENLGSTMKFAVLKMAELESLLLEVTYMFLGGKWVTGFTIQKKVRSSGIQKINGYSQVLLYVPWVVSNITFSIDSANLSNFT